MPSVPLLREARSASGIIARGFLQHFAVALIVIAGLCALLTLTVDPYGVSPLGLRADHVNQYRPKRLDIDRLIKPYEVWRFQPRTVFLGTSRIHQGIDPALLDGTRFAPAYNASVPAVSLGMNISYLDEYASLDRKLHTVFAELFLYNFLGQGQEHEPQPLKQMVLDAGSLFVSYNTVWDALFTLWYNVTKNQPCFEIAPGGYFRYPPGHDAKGTFDAFPAGMWDIDRKQSGKPSLSEAALASLDELIETARRDQVELALILTPNHPYFWHYIDTIDRWDLVTDWLTRVTGKAPVLSFSQPNPWTYEPVSHHMTYWNDPFHFSLAMGAGMMKSLTGVEDPALPANFLLRLTPDRIAPWITAQREAVRAWAADNRDFVTAFEAEKQKVRGTAQ